MKRIAFIIAVLCGTLSATAQIDGLGIRTSFLSWAMLSPSLGADISWNSRYLLAVDGSYGDWKISHDTRTLRLSTAGAEIRRYFSNGEAIGVNPNGGAYRGMYLGIDGRYIKFDNTLRSTGNEGHFVTAGLVVGYTFRLRGNWAVDASAGCGWVWKDYNRYKSYAPAGKDRRIGTVKENGFGLTNLNVALVYKFNLQ